MKTVFVSLFLSCAFFFFGSFGQLLQAQCPSGKERVAIEHESIEKEILRLVNQERKKRRLSPLAWDEGLAKACRYHAQDMARNDYFDHNTMQRSGKRLKTGCGFHERTKKFLTNDIFPRSENIAMGQRSAEQVVKSWMQSPGHRKNILDPRVKTMGAGMKDFYWVQVFGM